MRRARCLIPLSACYAAGNPGLVASDSGKSTGKGSLNFGEHFGGHYGEEWDEESSYLLTYHAVSNLPEDSIHTLVTSNGSPY